MYLFRYCNAIGFDGLQRFSHCGVRGGFVGLRIAFGDSRAPLAGISKTRAVALRQFEIPGAKAARESFAETAPMQPNKPAPEAAMCGFR